MEQYKIIAFHMIIMTHNYGVLDLASGHWLFLSHLWFACCLIEYSLPSFFSCPAYKSFPNLRPLLLFPSVLCFSMLYHYMGTNFLWDLVLKTGTGCISILDSVLLVAYNFPSFLCIEIVYSFDLIEIFVKTKHLWETKAFSELFLSLLGVYSSNSLC